MKAGKLNGFVANPFFHCLSPYPIGEAGKWHPIELPTLWRKRFGETQTHHGGNVTANTFRKVGLLFLCLYGCGRPESATPPSVSTKPPEPRKIATQPTPPPEKPLPWSEEGELSSLFPCTVGSVWEYTAQTGGQKYKYTQKVVAEKTEGGKTLFTIEMKRDGSIVQQEIYSIDKTGIYRVAFGENASGKIIPPMPILKLPLTTGNSWLWKGAFLENNGQTQTGGVISSLLSGPEPVKIGTKGYQAYRVEQSILLSDAQNSQRTKNTIWFAPNVGIVKQVTGEGIESVVAELIKYNEGPQEARPTGFP